MAKQRLLWWRCFAALLHFLSTLASNVSGFTNVLDAMALQDLYRALNSPPQLQGWRSDGGDPCRESWTGVSCSGSSVLHLQLQGLNLSGYLGGQLYLMQSLKHLDVSSNYIVGEIPYGLPPNATHINLASNSFSENIPHSLPSLKFLEHLNLSHNSLSGPIGDVFDGLQSLREMDLSYNIFNGDLPRSFGSLTNLTRLFLQNNQFTGSVIYLADLPLIDLNIQYNQFSGVIPTQFHLITNLWMDGNHFHKGANYPPWNYPLHNVSERHNFTAPPTTQSSAILNYPYIESAEKKGKLGPGGISCVVGGVTLVVTCAAIFIALRAKRAHASAVRMAQEDSPAASEGSPQLLPVKSPPFLGPRHLASTSPPECKNVHSARVSRSSKSFANKYNAPLSAKRYTVPELQSATNSFSEENLLGEGSLGSVYKAEFPDGQVFAVKNINMVSLSFQEEEQFLDVIWTVSCLRHPNIVTLLGYCVEHGQHLLVYEYVRNLSLHDALHSGAYKPLSWTIRFHIALGVARALDCLHSTFSPPVAHGNIKSANVLLDADLIPHLCDCGLAILKPFTSNSIKLKASEIAIADTGYIEPEHGEPGVDYTKSDIYAFGVLLLEIITGRKPFDSSRPREEQSLVKWASSRLHDSGFLVHMVDPSIRRTISSKVLSRYADVVSQCTQPEKFFRPQMSEIVESLTRMLQKITTLRHGTLDCPETEPFERSFRSTYTRFISSPTTSYHSF